jgi:hypothetical protein
MTLTAALAACTSTSTGKPSTPPSLTTPTTPTFPTAKDGQNYKACNDGNCEVLIRKSATIILNGETNIATVQDGSLRLADSDGYVSVSGGSTGVSWGNSGGPVHDATLKASDGDTVIVIITTRP